MSAAPEMTPLSSAQAVLDRLANGLATADLDAIVAASSEIETAAAALRRVRATAGARASDDTRADIEAVRRALGRCRRLGASLADAIRVARAAQDGAGADDSYGPHGDPVRHREPLRAVELHA